MRRKHDRGWLLRALQAVIACCAAQVLAVPSADPLEANFGPYNLRILDGGVGVARTLATDSPLLEAGAPWSMLGWVNLAHESAGPVIIAALGSVAGNNWRGLRIHQGTLQLVLGPPPTPILSAASSDAPPLEAGRWHFIAATFDGASARLYVDGAEAGVGAASTQRVAPQLQLAPVEAATSAAPTQHFGGELAQFSVAATALPPAAVRRLAASRPEFSLITFNAIGVGWPWQEHAWRGLQEPQDPWTLPGALSSPDPPIASVPVPGEGLHAEGSQRWTLHSWHLRAASEVAQGGADVSSAKFRELNWLAAVVPGTVLTTLIERGIYPDPDKGLNNLAIPDSLNRQDYWYRSVFDVPASLQNRELTLTFKGINYAAEVWLNGERLGAIKGAFIRGVFDATGKILPGRSNVLAVRISPPPHPGIPHEQSMAAGPGENGGMLAIDGPTFIATEGWDWIPGIRDRNSGIWQEVELSASDALRLLDPHVITRLQGIDAADISITVAVENRAAAPIRARIGASFDAVSVQKAITVAPGITEVSFNPREYPQLHLLRPRLWWPNGYGPANLYQLRIDASADGRPSDSATVKFGVRTLSYELSLFDSQGRLRRVEVDPTAGSAANERLVDSRHEAIKRTPQGWAQSLTAAGEVSSAVRPIGSDSLTPYLTIRVNGVPIAARGGSWGMDDSRKRISRARLEPYFKLEHDANLNIIRNWLGQNTEDVFYELADQYGLLVLNDFWVSTQDFQVEPQDPELFLANARDVISRYRNHPSIAVWFGRNEGVPQPIINEGLAGLVATLDGTRLYTGSSNSVNLQGSGPYNYRPPEQYFTDLAQGFSVEVGTPSLSTLESLRASIPAADRWPLSDTYAYHDWHFGGNGDVASFMAALTAQYGPASGLEDFERKAQMMDYVSYRAIFEGFQAHLWTKNSGRLLWMTHPSWPSNTWQIYSSDYDMAAPYFAVKKACEPVHAQLNLPDFSVAVANISLLAQRDLHLRSRIISLDNRILAERFDAADVAANSVTTLAPLPLESLLAGEGLVLVRLTLTDAHGALVSENTYWQGRDAGAYRRLNELSPQPVEVSARAARSDEGMRVEVALVNRGREPALAAKLTMLDAHRDRVLPVYYDDNYIALLPGETRRIRVLCPAGSARCATVALRGWNVLPREASIAGYRQ